MESREIHVAPDRFELSSAEALFVTELSSAIAVCLYDAAEEAGALLLDRCIQSPARRRLRFRPNMGWVHTRA